MLFTLSWIFISVFCIIIIFCRSRACNTQSPFALCSILEKDKLNGTKYAD